MGAAQVSKDFKGKSGRFKYEEDLDALLEISNGIVGEDNIYTRLGGLITIGKPVQIWVFPTRKIVGFGSESERELAGRLAAAYREGGMGDFSISNNY